MEASIDIVVIGAGPAGLSAARSARDDGLSVVLLDEQPEPGGQIWRAVGRVSETRPADLSLFGASYEKGVAAASDLQGIDTRFGATVWQVEKVTSKWRVTFSQKSTASRVETAAVVIATGAQERSVPIPGWTLPGVTTVGALQLGLKQSGIYPSGKVVLAGGGPLPLLLASCSRRLACLYPDLRHISVGRRRCGRSLARGGARGGGHIARRAQAAQDQRQIRCPCCSRCGSHRG